MKSWTAIWTEIAEAFDPMVVNKTAKQKAIANLGLCHAMRWMGKEFNIPQRLVLDHPGFWWEWSKTGNAYRATFAGLMAAMGDKGFKSFLKWCEKHP